MKDSDLKSNKKSQQYSRPRMLAMWLARKHTRNAYSEIGDFFGGRSHSTVISAQKKIDYWRSESSEWDIADRVYQISEIIRLIEQRLAG